MLSRLLALALCLSPTATAAAAITPAAASVPASCNNSFGTGNHAITLPSGRQFVLHVPPPGKVAIAAPLLVHMHGCGTLNTTRGVLVDNPDYQDTLTGLNAGADKQGFLVAYPVGLPAVEGTCTSIDGSVPLGFNAGGCCGNTGADDVSFVRDLVQSVQASMCVNDRAIFSSGFSSGAMMSHRLACEAADLFSGIASVEGNIFPSAEFKSCKPSKPLSVLMLCGGADFVCLPTFRKTIKQWQGLLACGDSTTTTYSTATSTCTRFDHCENATVLEHCTTKKIGHCWPGEVEGLREGICEKTGPEPSTDMDATSYVLQYFRDLVGAM